MGHTLESCTSEIKIVKLSVPELADGDVVFVDTPGFDDTHKSDADILKMVADWLKTTYDSKISFGSSVLTSPSQIRERNITERSSLLPQDIR